MEHTILICRYRSICEPDVIDGFQKNGYMVDEFSEELNDVDYDVEYMKKLAERITAKSYRFVFSINFFPIISVLCNALHIPYVCWLVDSPVFTLYSQEVCGEYNRIFIFDHALYEQFYPKNPQGIFYLPLGANVSYWTKVCRTVTDVERIKYGHPISFVGSLYSEKCPYNQIAYLPETLRKELEQIMKEQEFVYDRYFLAERLTDDKIQEFKTVVNLDVLPEGYDIEDAVFIADAYLAIKVSEQERIHILERLAEEFPVSLYTESNSSFLENVIFHGSAESRKEMPKIFHCSKINLNPTARSIKTGISQRVFDVLGCQGFLLTNYQEEILQYFEPGVDMEVYQSLEELVDKCRFYLYHEKERQCIARKGYEKIVKYHTYEIRIREMLKKIGEMI